MEKGRGETSYTISLINQTAAATVAQAEGVFGIGKKNTNYVITACAAAPDRCNF